MSLRSTLVSTDKYDISIYGHDWEIELSLEGGEDGVILSSEEAEGLAKSLLRAAEIKRLKKWIYE